MLVSIPCFCSASQARMPSHVDAICRVAEFQRRETEGVVQDSDSSEQDMGLKVQTIDSRQVAKGTTLI